jgi:hypothetical protein
MRALNMDERRHYTGLLAREPIWQVLALTSNLFFRPDSAAINQGHLFSPPALSGFGVARSTDTPLAGVVGS